MPFAELSDMPALRLQHAVFGVTFCAQPPLDHLALARQFYDQVEHPTKWQAAPDSQACWPWTGLLRRGVPVFRTGGFEASARLFAHRLTKGEVAPGQRVRPTCGQALCLFQHHLCAGRPGPRSRLRPGDLAALRAARAEGQPLVDLTRMFDLSLGRVWDLVHDVELVRGDVNRQLNPGGLEPTDKMPWRQVVSASQRGREVALTLSCGHVEARAQVQQKARCWECSLEASKMWVADPIL